MVSKRFYDVGGGIEEGEMVFRWLPSDLEDSEAEAICRGHRQPQMPVLLERTKGREHDFVACQGRIFFFSEKAISILRGSGLTGWREYDVTFRGPTPKMKYFGVMIVGRAGKFLGGYDAKRGIILRFDADAWDGSDLFVLDKGCMVFCSRRFKDCWVQGGLSGMGFGRVDE